MLLLSLTLACGSKKQITTTAEAISEPEASYSESEIVSPQGDVKKESEITVIEVGEEPLKQLVYTVKPIEDIQYKMIMKSEMMVIVEEEEIVQTFSMNMLLNNSIIDVQKDGSYTAVSRFDEFKLSSMNPDINNALMDSVRALEGLSVTASYNSQGELLEQSYRATEDIPPEVLKVMKSSYSSLSNTSLGFPKEAIGLGAKWKIETETETQGVKTTQAILCSLVAFDGQKGTIDAIIGQEMKNEEAVAGIDDFSSQGSIVYQFDLNSPTTATVSMGLNTSFVITTAEKPRPFQMKITLDGEALE
jgi:hypothetical protein